MSSKKKVAKMTPLKAPEGIQIHAGYSSGNITLVSDDNIGFKIEDYYLKARSEVLRNMLGSSPISTAVNIRIPETTQHVLRILIDAFLGKPLGPIDWKSARPALHLCKVYEIPTFAHRILFASIDDVSMGDLHEALIISSEHNARHAAFHVLMRGHGHPVGDDSVWNDDIDAYERRSASYATPAIEPFQQWTKDQINRLPKDWIWALMNAALDAHQHYLEGSRRQSVEYWRELAQGFLKHTKEGGKEESEWWRNSK